MLNLRPDEQRSVWSFNIEGTKINEDGAFIHVVQSVSQFSHAPRWMWAFTKIETGTVKQYLKPDRTEHGAWTTCANCVQTHPEPKLITQVLFAIFQPRLMCTNTDEFVSEEEFSPCNGVAYLVKNSYERAGEAAFQHGAESVNRNPTRSPYSGAVSKSHE